MTDVTINMNAAADVATYNNIWTTTGNSGAYGLLRDVCDTGEGLDFNYLSTWQASFSGYQQTPRSVRFMCDADKFAILLNASANLPNHGFRLYVDGVPARTTPSTPTATGTTVFHTVVFPTARPRLIELRFWTMMGGLYCPKPYQIYKPPARKGPRVLIMGDSWTSNANTSVSIMNSCYWDIGKLIGSEDVWLDYYGGTGYGVTNAGDGVSGTQNSYLSRVSTDIPLLDQVWSLPAINPDVLLIHGGGANDKFKGRTNAQVIESVIETFETARTRLPNTKLIFVEGFLPAGFRSVTNDGADYTVIRDGARAALTDTGVYYLETSAGGRWFDGLGNAGSPNADNKNNNIYMSSDNYHKNDAGHLYLRNRIAPKIARVISDRGDLVNEII